VTTSIKKLWLSLANAAEGTSSLFRQVCGKQYRFFIKTPEAFGTLQGLISIGGANFIATLRFLD
jgi:hypothetical protein